MKMLLLGATGATGRLVAKLLLEQGHSIIAIVRTPEKLPESVRQHSNSTVVKANLIEMNEAELAKYVGSCEAAASCLGHKVSLAGMYGRPGKLVTESVQRICKAIRSGKSSKPYRFILMNSAGVTNQDVEEKVDFGQKALLGLIRLLVPPHVDNENAAEVLRMQMGQNNSAIEWAVVRPDSLTNELDVTAYEVHPSPTRSALFNPGKTSRINVAHFMAELLTDDVIWQRWKGQMPVIYNSIR